MNSFDFAFYWKLFWRRLPVMTLFILLCSSLGVITAMNLPETWSTSARLLVEAPQIPDEMVASTVQTDAVEQLDIIQQKLLTRANLIDIAHKFQVFEDIQDMEPDNVVDQMREQTRIRRTAGRNQATLMTLGFDGRTGPIAADVVQEYVTLVLAENADFRITRAENTLGFFEQEVERLGQELDQQSTAIAVFKTDNADSLPEDQGYRLGRQTLLQERLSRLERELAAFRAQRAEVMRIFEATGRVGVTSRSQPRTPEQEQLTVARAELDHAKSIYSETHPRVTRLSSTVARLEAVVAAQEAEQTGTAEDDTRSPEEAMLQATLAEIDTRSEYLEDDVVTTNDELEALQVAISRSSANGIALASLERDYVNIQLRYNTAVNNLDEARMSERIETTAQGQRITVIENANVPQVPTGPHRTRIALMGLALGLAMAGGYFMLLEILNRTVRRPAELISRYNVTPITTIPYMESRARRRVRRSGIVLATLAVLAGVPAALWYIDTQILPLAVVVQKGLSQLGLG